MYIFLCRALGWLLLLLCTGLVIMTVLQWSHEDHRGAILVAALFCAVGIGLSQICFQQADRMEREKN